ncbi:hypothetical protein AURDEDRAFT_174257 [Auricularia subglabra TFB-10046 SS5]|uniref:Uncharacterized protein n=1 Tax=Auricularia subglabra (strain TFB-10046 / SS5) TaxID=717982 RepID=J0LGE9_AURST|nr:hypothetical protein AURDEDRAFT_174257 [Auricularia subglabra TFB-10046 SS5]
MPGRFGTWHFRTATGGNLRPAYRPDFPFVVPHPQTHRTTKLGAHEDLGEIDELEQQVYEGLSPDDQRVFLELSYEERDVCVEMTPEDREIFLGMSPEERAEWMNDVDADGDDGADVAAQSSSRANKSITFDDGDQTTTGSELDYSCFGTS